MFERRIVAPTEVTNMASQSAETATDHAEIRRGAEESGRVLIEGQRLRTAR
jgi:hypothetical protein